mgnify:CR=1 FL=1
MSLLRFALPLRRFQWCRRRLGGRWELWRHWKRGRYVNERAEWIWVSDEKVFGFMRNVWRPLEVIDVEDYRLTRIDISHVPEVNHG